MHRIGECHLKQGSNFGIYVHVDQLQNAGVRVHHAYYSCPAIACKARAWLALEKHSHMQCDVQGFAWLPHPSTPGTAAACRMQTAILWSSCARATTRVQSSWASDRSGSCLLHPACHMVHSSAELHNVASCIPPAQWTGSGCFALEQLEHMLQQPS